MDQPNQFHWDEEKWERFFENREEEEARQEEWEAEDCYLEDIVVYQLAKDFAAEALDFSRATHSHRKSVRDALERLITYAPMVSAYLAAAHALGYEPETIGGNIALCRRSLRAVKEAQEALHEIQARYGKTVASLWLASLASEVRFQLEEWIREIRGRKWD